MASPTGNHTNRSRAAQGRAGKMAAGLASRCVIVIPVYNSFVNALECIRSVLAHSGRECRLLVIDDASREGRLADHLPAEIKADPRLELRRNRQNLGFVGTCNRGMRRTRPADVVLLNSDTVVTAGWLRKLRRAAASSARVGMVSPLTNNGEICSVPVFLRNNSLPAGYRLDEFAALVERVSTRSYPPLPTCVGFCAYLKRSMLERIGLFDTQRFGKGYGEENDLSRRALAAGYTAILDDATFVFHHGAASFGARARRMQARHLRILERKHPGYSHIVHEFCERNPLADVQTRIREEMLRRWNDAASRRVLHVLHKSPLTADGQALPGGVEYHVADLVRTVPGAHWSLYPADGVYCLKAHLPGAEHVERLPASAATLEILLRRFAFDVIHLHQAAGFPYDRLVELLRRHGRYFVSVHDYGLICPALHLVDRQGKLCDGRQCVEACGENRRSVRRLRANTAQLLDGALAVLHFSQSTRADFERCLGRHGRWRELEHGIALPPDAGQGTNLGPWPKPAARRPLKVAFLGAISRVKGAELIRKIVRRQTLPSAVPVEWHLIGTMHGAVDPHLVQHGSYRRADLPALLAQADPHLVAILSLCPETYCFTLDESLRCGVPVICTPRGAPAERVARRGCGWLLKRLRAADFLHALDRLVADWDEYRAVRRQVSQIRLCSVEEAAEPYGRMYCAVPPARAAGPTEKLRAALARLRRRLAQSPSPLAGSDGHVLRDGLPQLSAYELTLRRIRKLAGRAVPPDATVLVMSKGDPQLLELGGARAWHFPQNVQGCYSGFYPAGSTAAIAHLEWLRAAGATHLLMPGTANWWLDHYPGFRRHLRTHYPTLLRRKNTCAIFALRDGRDCTEARLGGKRHAVLAGGRRGIDGTPRVSIIVAADGATSSTAWLANLEQTLPRRASAEVILVGDRPAREPRAERERFGPGDAWTVRRLLISQELSFARRANQAAAEARGQWLLFLAGGAVLLPHWLPVLLRTLREQPDAGAVGGRLLFPDGRIHDAGGVVYRDATLDRFGHEDYQVDAPRYQHVRIVDFCSAALMLTARRLFTEIGGFDSAYRADLYRDAEYGFQLRRRRLHVYCAPGCVAVTPELGPEGSGTSGSADRRVFATRWREMIACQPRRETSG
jgi:GT2 family glycosyltransferase